MLPDSSQAGNVQNLHGKAHQKEGGAQPEVLSSLQWHFGMMLLPGRAIVKGFELGGPEQVKVHLDLDLVDEIV